MNGYRRCGVSIIHIYIHTYIYTHTHTHTMNTTQPKKEWNNVICSNMDATRDYHTKWSKSERERQTPYDIIYMWNLKHGTNESIYETERESRT